LQFFDPVILETKATRDHGWGNNVKQIIKIIETTSFMQFGGDGKTTVCCSH